MLYMLGFAHRIVTIAASGTCGVLGSVASVALYNFFLTEPSLTSPCV